MIICLGWGSLIWCPKALPVRGAWQSDGPVLPVEFARECRDKRITLVLCDESPAIPVLWAELEVESLDEARNRLATREGVRDGNIRRSIGYWGPDAAGDHPRTAAIGDWARPRGVVGVVWTALKPKISEEFRVPSEAEVIGHLQGLRGDVRDLAKEYVRLAPRQIVTPYRTAIEAALGWTPLGWI